VETVKKLDHVCSCI